MGAGRGFGAGRRVVRIDSRFLAVRIDPHASARITARSRIDSAAVTPIVACGKHDTMVRTAHHMAERIQSYRREEKISIALGTFDLEDLEEGIHHFR